ncbi:MAG: hypothetical protein WAN17_10795 [Candidatus Sulfotelmatobacter sp.]
MSNGIGFPVLRGIRCFPGHTVGFTLGKDGGSRCLPTSKGSGTSLGGLKEGNEHPITPVR